MDCGVTVTRCERSRLGSWGREDLVSTGTSRSLEAECPAWAAGVSAQTFSVTIGGSMGSGRKELGIHVTT